MRNTKYILTPLPQKWAKDAGRPDRAWAVSYHRLNDQGELVLARSYFRSKAEAADFCAERKADKASLGNLAAGLSDDFKREALACADKLRPYGHSLTDAVDAFVRDLELAGASKTVQETLNHHLASARASGCGSRHIDTIESICGAFAADYRARKVSTIKAPEIQAWLESRKVRTGKRKGEPLSPTTFNSFKNYLSGLFAHAVDQGWTEGNPMQRVKARKVRERPLRLLSPGDLRSILAAADESLRPILAVQAFCPVRTAEASRLRWEDILPGGHLRIEASASKTGMRRTIPIRDTLLRYLVKRRKPSGYIYGGEAGATPNALVQQIKARVRSALPGVAWGKNAMRASCVSYRLAETQDLQRTALEAGHTPDVLRSKYQQLTTPDEAARWFAVDPDSPQAKVIPFLPKMKRRRSE